MKIKDYYSLKEIEKLTDLKYRQLQNRILTIQEKYKNNVEKIYKLKNRWYIHYSIIKEFEKKKISINYKQFISISSRNKLDYDYWYIIIKDIDKDIYNNLDKYNRTRFVIEKNKNGFNHLHFLTTFNDKKLLNNIIKKNRYIDNNDMNILIENVYDVNGLYKYFRKENKPVLIKKRKNNNVS